MAGRVRRHRPAVHRADGYIEKYGRIARLLADWNLATATFDWRGQGLADRVAGDPNIGHVRHFEDYQAGRRGLPEGRPVDEVPRTLPSAGAFDGRCDRPAAR